MEQSNEFRKDYLCHFGDTSNQFNGTEEGYHERQQRLAKEQRLKELAKYNAKQIADRMLKGELGL
jgi:hypothetical protein